MKREFKPGDLVKTAPTSSSASSSRPMGVVLELHAGWAPQADAGNLRQLAEALFKFSLMLGIAHGLALLGVGLSVADLIALVVVTDVACDLYRTYSDTGVKVVVQFGTTRLTLWPGDLILVRGVDSDL